MGIGEDDLLNCSVTIMPILNKTIGFLRRDQEDSYPNLLLAPGGSIETPDGIDVDGVKYYSVEEAAVRELWEKTGIKVPTDKLIYFCSLSLPTPRVTLSFYCEITYSQVIKSLNYLEFYGYSEIVQREDFAPGMKYEALKLLERLNLK